MKNPLILLTLLLTLLSATLQAQEQDTTTTKKYETAYYTIETNLPQVVRKGDWIVISIKIHNLSDYVFEGSTGLCLTDTLTGKDIYINWEKMYPLPQLPEIGLLKIYPNTSETYYWNILIPKNIQAITIGYNINIFFVVEEINRFILKDNIQDFFTVLPHKSEKKYRNIISKIKSLCKTH